MLVVDCAQSKTITPPPITAGIPKKLPAKNDKIGFRSGSISSAKYGEYVAPIPSSISAIPPIFLPILYDLRGTYTGVTSHKNGHMIL